ncbi:DgyrCDS2465 [Dimorphilus gyrociliatus]|uniref:DgyrCDS2465 n=1 Tax=Dimorphilus gyrociliatus TaxID=2664684 RepID=A0A7I8VBP6_9ANNE|nr:DgyrCDS2465 [Dimorphilus gyrociliatus]
MLIDKTYRSSFWGANGFDNLKNYMKQSNDFIKNLSGLLQERSEAELNFSKNLSKISKKLSRYCSTELTIYEAWGMSASEMEQEAEAHKNVSIAINDIYKQMKELDEMFAKNRKPHEDLVTKTNKDLKRMRCDEKDRSKEAFNCHKDYEKARDTVQRADKIQKLDGKAQFADNEYKKTCLKLEEARQAYETAVFNGCHELQKLDEIRISKMKDMLTAYNNSISSVIPVVNQSSDKIRESIGKVNATKDMNAVVELKGTMCNKPEQVLITFYAENSHNLADNERRRFLLQGHLSSLQSDATTTVKALEGIKKTMDVFKRDNFKNEDAYNQARHGYWQCHAKLEMLEASQYKISRALAELDCSAKPVSEYEKYIEKSGERGHEIWFLRKPYPPDYPGTVPERLLPQKSCDDYDDEFGK